MVTSTQKTNKSNMAASASTAEEQPNVSASDDRGAQLHMETMMKMKVHVFNYNSKAELKFKLIDYFSCQLKSFLISLLISLLKNKIFAR